MHDCFESFPTPRRATRSTVNDEAVWILRHIRIEIIHEHAEGGFLVPALAAHLRPARRADHSFSTHNSSSSLSKSPARMASATRSISADVDRSSSSGGTNARSF